MNIQAQGAGQEWLTRAALAALAAVAAACLLTGTAGAASSWVSGHGWRWTPASRTARALQQLAQTPGDPASAFPAPVAAGIPGPTAFWAVYAVLAAAALVVGAAVLRLAWAGREPAPQRARWATRHDETRIAVTRDPERRPCRLVAGRGRRTGRLLAAEDCISAVAFGPNGSGKSTALVVPNVLEWPGPVVMTTTKAQDAALVLNRRRALGPVWVIAPAGSPGLDLARWSPVDYATDADAADRMAEWLCEASGLSQDIRSRAWVLQARKLIKPLLLAAHLSGGGLDAFVRWIYDGRAAAEQVTAILTDAGHLEARREYASTWAIHDEGIGSVLFTAYGLADVYARHAVRAATENATGGTVDLAALTGPDPATLVIVAPEADAERFAPLITALIAAVVHQGEQAAAARSGPLTPRLLLALDEAANVFRFPRLPALLTTARGNGIQLLLAYHDLGQLEHVTGSRQVARTVISNAKLRILLPGVGDLDTLRYFSDLFGRTAVNHASRTRGTDGRTTTSTSEASDDLAPLHTLRQLPDGQAIAQYQNLPPMPIRLRYNYRDPDLRALARADS